MQKAKFGSRYKQIKLNSHQTVDVEHRMAAVGYTLYVFGGCCEWTGYTADFWSIKLSVLSSKWNILVMNDTRTSNPDFGYRS